MSHPLATLVPVVPLLLLSLFGLPDRAAHTLPPAPPGPTAQAGPFPVYRYTLPNGLRIWCQPRDDSRSVHASLVLRAGARYENEANSGISHFVEHMLFTGTARRSEEEIRETITRRGGRWNGMTGQEDTTYYAEVASGDFDLALDWLSDVVFYPTLPADKVERERQIIFQERWGKYGWLLNLLERWGFGYDLGREVRSKLFPGSTLLLRTIGEDASLERISRADLLAYYNEFYVPSNAVLVVVGKVSPEQVLERATAHFGPVPAKPQPAAVPPVPAAGPGPYQAVVRGPLPTDQVGLMAGARTVGQTHPDHWPLAVLGQVLSKELRDEARYRHGWVYGIWASNTEYEDVGYFVISTETAPRYRDAIMAMIDEQLERVRRGELPPERVAEAQAALQGQWALSMENNGSRAAWLAGWATVLGDDRPVPDYAAEIGAVTAGDLIRVVDKYFTPANHYVAVHEPIITVPGAGRAAGVVALVVVGAVATRRWWPRAGGRATRMPAGPRE